MSKVSSHKKPLIISGDRATEAIRQSRRSTNDIGLDLYLKNIGYKSIFAAKSVSIDFTDEEFAQMLQALKEDK